MPQQAVRNPLATWFVQRSRGHSTACLSLTRLEDISVRDERLLQQYTWETKYWSILDF